MFNKIKKSPGLDWFSQVGEQIRDIRHVVNHQGETLMFEIIPRLVLELGFRCNSVDLRRQMLTQEIKESRLSDNKGDVVTLHLSFSETPAAI